MKKQLLLLLMMLLPMVASAHDIEVANADGVTIYYSWINIHTELAVSCRGSSCDSYSNEYSGNVVIPESVTYNGNTYSVTSIGTEAFYGCRGLTSIEIPNSVTSLGNRAFSSCSALTPVTIPNSVTSIGNYTFYNCIGLTSVSIPNSVTSIGECTFQFCSGLTSVTIGNSLTSIGDRAFSGCSGLTSMSVESENSVFDSRDECNAIIETVTNTLIAGCKNTIIPNSVTSIGDRAFSSCIGLTSITIPNSVTSIGSGVFSGCSGLTSMSVESENSVYDSRNGCNAIIETATNTLIAGCKNTIIPNSVTSIGSYAFSGLTSITIPNSVTSIESDAFSGCSSLTSVTIGNSVTSIGSYAFYDCSNLTSVKVLATTPPTAQNNSFYKYTIPLYVPETSIETYRTTSPWSSFTSIGALSPEDYGIPCATPTIKYVGGKLKFECETEGVEFVSHFSTPAGADNNTSEVEIPTTYTVSVYAKKDGYLDSETVTTDIDIRGLKGDVNQDGVVSITDAVSVVNIILNSDE